VNFLVDKQLKVMAQQLRQFAPFEDKKRVEP